MNDGTSIADVPRVGAAVAVTATRLGRLLEVPAALAVVVALWQLTSVAVGNKTLVPSPLLVLTAWVELVHGDLRDDVLASLMHLALGYALGAGTGLALAVLSARFAVVETIVDPLVELLRPISAIAWIPLAILMFGVSAKVPVFLIFYAALFPIFVNTLAGMKQVDPQLVRAARALGASPRLILTHVVIPSALPFMLAGARLSLGVAWMAMVAAELTGSDAGLGWRLFWYQEFFAMNKVMAVILTIGVLGYVLDALLRWLQTRITRWSPDASRDDMR
ncbi:MAG TPA: ABC transporter permease [Casimicrobiaceae bacterium]|nr:ABC transporter permease [Casimicrobiaceae bacterium]